MDTVLAVSFDDHRSAFSALTTLKELDDQGQIELFEAAVVERDEAGRLMVRDEVKEHTPPGLRTARDGLIAGLAGALLAGPVGLLIGGTVGTLTGAAVDLSSRDEDEGLLAQYARHIAPGDTSVLAHLEEPEVEAVDAAMSALGGRVLRQGAQEVSAELSATQTAG